MGSTWGLKPDTCPPPTQISLTHNKTRLTPPRRIQAKARPHNRTSNNGGVCNPTISDAGVVKPVAHCGSSIHPTAVGHEAGEEGPEVGCMKNLKCSKTHLNCTGASLARRDLHSP